MFEKVTIKKSSFIKEIGFVDNIITVTMKNNKIYQYPATSTLFLNFLMSESKGKFYNLNLKH